MYIFYYSYLDEIYGVIAQAEGFLLVELIRTNEVEQISASWLRSKILGGLVDISLKSNSLEFHEKEKLSKYLPTSA